jgi:hypothetical protein
MEEGVSQNKHTKGREACLQMGSRARTDESAVEGEVMASCA